MKKKMRERIIIIIILLVVLLTPIPTKMLADGGTVQYNAVLYSFVVRHIDISTPDMEKYITGTDFYFFSFNFGNKIVEKDWDEASKTHIGSRFSAPDVCFMRD
ncbi:MAG: hypothetical protein A2Y17_07755 [Clostridiales bacterium GWF2_38_85]|nr:MAG: hypothetical protein A2Y17_07755 [Clostridiales bacterium GWF2_38_85]HBL84230.1 hypothetical protein [Clostridiales bacterium]